MPNLSRKVIAARQDKPSTWGSTSISSYYTKKHADKIRPFLDAIAEDNTKFSIFDSRECKMSMTTLYARITQGWKYLIEKEDAEGKYALLRKTCILKRGRTSFTLCYNTESKFQGITGELCGGVDVVDWRTQLVSYVEEAADGTEPLEVKGIPFLEEDMDWIAQYLAPFKEQMVLIKMTSTSFKVVKNSKLAALIKERKGE